MTLTFQTISVIIGAFICAVSMDKCIEMNSETRKPFRVIKYLFTGASGACMILYTITLIELVLGITIASLLWGSFWDRFKPYLLSKLG